MSVFRSILSLIAIWIVMLGFYNGSTEVSLNILYVLAGFYICCLIYDFANS